MAKTIVFVENIDPYIEPASGIGIYLKKLIEFLNIKGLETILIGVSESMNGKLKIPVNKFINIGDYKVSHPVFIIKLFTRIRGLTFKPDVIFHGQRPDVLFPIIMLKNNNKFVCTLHGIHSQAVYHKKGRIRGYIYELLEKYTLSRVNKVIAVSSATQDHYILKYPNCYNKTITIPIGVDFNVFFQLNKIRKEQVRKNFEFNVKDKIILFIGRLEKEKNLEFLMDVSKIVIQEIPECKLVLVGTGSLERQLKSYALDKGYRHVFFLNAIPNNLVAQIMNTADLFTLCSLYEGSPTVIKEALACNIPVVSMDVGDVYEIIGGLKGCKIVKPDIISFSSAVISLLNSRSSYSFREHIIKYDNQSVFLRTLELYYSLS